MTTGFTPDEIAQRTAEIQRLHRRGENIYYTPLSDNKHHILIDDMNRAKLDKLIQDGYQPAAVLESSQGNYQAIITVPKLGTAHDKDVGNHLAERLNQEYGDPKLSGCIHPHCAPGYESALRQCAPVTRQDEQGHDWNDYAQRTARYAFGGAGDRQAADLGKYRQQWEKLEGREQKPQIEIAQPKKEVVVEVKRDREP